MRPLRSVMQHDFSMTPKAEIPRSSFARVSNHKTTFNSGYLVPVYYDEVLPGDTFSLQMTAMARLSTPLFPYMDNLFMNSFFFFIPMRLLWDNWQKFMGEQRNPGDSTDFLIPQITATAGTGYAANSIFDYFALPVGIPGFAHSALFLRAYNLCWNEWFRDENLQDSVTVPVDDGPDAPTLYTLLRRGKRHDYFSSALPWPQKGDSVEIPLGTKAPIMGIGVQTAGVFSANVANVRDTDTPARTYAFGYGLSAGNAVIEGAAAGSNVNPQVYADLTRASAATVNSLRQAFGIQKLLERDARGGTRYTEIIRAHFNVVSPDARLQRPEYLGGGQTIINVHTVPQTSSTDAQPTPQGNLSAYATAVTPGGFSKSFTEHGIILGMVSVRADLHYQQGLNRMWSRRTKYDFYWPALSHIGEQAVLNKEIFCVGSANLAQDEAVFGYQERYAEYRYYPSVITGEFRSSFPQSLDSWHLAQDFGALPALNAAFIEDHPPVDRIVAVETEPQFIADIFFKCRAVRPMPMYGVPGMMDRF